MADELVLRNYIAGAAIKAGQVVGLNSTQSNIAPSAVPSSDSILASIGVSLKDVDEGEAITYRPFISGEIYQVIAGDAITAGDALGVNSSSLLEPAGSGNVAVPLTALEAAAAANDVILAVCTWNGVVGS